MDDWDAAAETFDEEADHGLREPAVRAAWTELLLSVLPDGASTAADLACGTGSLSLLLAEAGLQVTGIDLSAPMLRVAERKAAASPPPRPVFLQGDVTRPDLPDAGFDVVVARHILFMLPEPESVVGRWVELLRPGGVLVLVEGFWSTGSGLTADVCAGFVRRHRAEARVVPLSDRAALWGRAVDDERYMVVSSR